GPTFTDRLNGIIQRGSGEPKPELRRFHLDFPGGTPREFVKAVQKASGLPVNVIISDENNDTMLSAIRVDDVTVPELFQAVSRASHREVRYGNNSITVGCSFNTEGSTTENSIWSFNNYKGPTPL